MTSAEFLAQPIECDHCGNRIRDELIGGEVVLITPSMPHDLIKNHINHALIHYLDLNPNLSLTSLVGLGVEVSEYDTFIPDVVVVRDQRLDAEARIFQGSPELAIEVVSPTDTEVHLRRKINAYLRAGSTAVWAVYPQSKSVMVYSGDTSHELKGDEKIEVTLLPGFSSPVSAFF